MAAAAAAAAAAQAREVMVPAADGVRALDEESGAVARGSSGTCANASEGFGLRGAERGRGERGRG